MTICFWVYYKLLMVVQRFGDKLYPAIKGLVWYPLALVLIWTLPTVNRVADMVDPKGTLAGQYWLDAAHAFCVSADGFVNSLAYAASVISAETLRRVVAKLCSCVCVQHRPYDHGYDKTLIDMHDRGEPGVSL